MVGSNRVSNSYSSGNVFGEDRVGGLVGDNACGDVSCSYATGAVAGEVNVGGLVGYAQGFLGGGGVAIGSVTDCYSIGGVTGDSYVGGLIGRNAGGYISHCYSVGGVTGHSSVGGLIGFLELPDVTASFWDAETSGCGESDAGTAKTTSQMRDILTFSRSWDIVAVAPDEMNEDYTWNIVDGETYPFLSWESTT
jgi:hypothetical protein